MRTAQANYDLLHPPANPPAELPAAPSATVRITLPASLQANPAVEPLDPRVEQQRRAEARHRALQRFWAADDQRIEEEAWDEAYARAAEERLALAHERDADWERSYEFWESLELSHFAVPSQDAESEIRRTGGSGQSVQPDQSTPHEVTIRLNQNVQPQGMSNQPSTSYQPLIHGHSSRYNYSPLTAALEESYRTGRKVTLKEDPKSDITHPHFVDR